MTKVKRERVHNAKDRWLTLDEEKMLLDASAPWLREIAILALNTGMRQGEILSLEWPHVDLFRKTLTVVRSKNGDKRTIPLHRVALDLLKSKAKVRSISGRYVFSTKAGTRPLRRNVFRAFYAAIERAEIQGFRFHDLRHTFATRLVQAGIDLYKVSKLLGHKDIRMTQRYAHHYPESLRDGVTVLERISTYLAQSPKNTKKGVGLCKLTP